VFTLIKEYPGLWLRMIALPAMTVPGFVQLLCHPNYQSQGSFSLQGFFAEG